MNDAFTTNDSPSPEFRAHLEWEITRAYRREQRLGTGRQQRRTRRLGIAAMVLICVLLGTGTNLALAQARDGARRDSLLDAARAELEIAQLRLDLVRKQVAEVSKRAALGAATARESSQAAAEVEAMTARLVRQQLNIAEITASKQAPRDELTAPLVAGRDFVKARIEAELSNAQRQLANSEAVRAELERQLRAGVVSQVEKMDGEVAERRATAEFAMLAERMRLREEYLAKKTPARELAAKLAEAQSHEDLLTAQQEMTVTRAKLDLLVRQRAAGAASELELLRMQLQVKEAERAVAEMTTRMRRISRGGADSLP